MPIYEYKCPDGHLFEVFHGMTEPGPETCEVCGKGPLQRVLHPVAVHYKGSGFYSTDYGRKSKHPKDGGSAEASSTSGDGGSAGGKADSSGGGSSGDSSGGGGGGGGGGGEAAGGSKKAAEA
ncbi:MAG: FmdB family zinc ribbon protein [Gaiellaceae bacterium]